MLTLGQEFGVVWGVREEEDGDDAEDDCDGAFDEEDEGPAMVAARIDLS